MLGYVNKRHMPADQTSPLPDGISIVIPVFNSAEALPVLIDRLRAAVTIYGKPYELILVNDGSTDKSWDTIERLSQRNERIQGICLLRNYGQHNALLCGIRSAKFSLIATLDDDLQHPPEELAKLLARIDEGFDVVYGVPKVERHGLLRDTASRITKIALQSSMGVDVARHVSAFRVFRTQLRDAFARYEGPHVSIDVLLTWGTTKFASVYVRHDPRTIGSSNYTLGKLVRHAFNMITGFSTLPLQVASLAGFIFTLIGALVLLFVVGRYLIQGSSVPGFPFLASIIAIFSGVQLFSLGIIGEYISRIHFRTMDRPTYAIRRRTDLPR